ncbi:uncharacterized protein [Anabrus simplex]|uniref:uncharacterized protein n=1 Tax=Anabrus simplex TaxID=316456 RepID=UPI0035A2A698
MLLDLWRAFEQLSPYESDVVTYIAGFVARKVEYLIKSAVCLCALRSARRNYTDYALIKEEMDSGGEELIMPSKYVIVLCKLTECVLRNISVLRSKEVHQKVLCRMLRSRFVSDEDIPDILSQFSDEIEDSASDFSDGEEGIINVSDHDHRSDTEQEAEEDDDEREFIFGKDGGTMWSTTHFSKLTSRVEARNIVKILPGPEGEIMRWRLELSPYSYDIVYRPGNHNQAADALSRVGSINHNTDYEKLLSLHQSLCHPGITRMGHWIRIKNLPFSIEDIRRVTSACRTCAEVKPQFFRHQGSLIKATAPFERLNLDFKGPLPTKTRNRYIFTVIDEFSRFPFAFACRDLSSSTVISCLTQLFSIFGAPSYIHTDRGSSFMSQDLKNFLASFGVATSRTTPYNPQGNGQVERFNGTIWRTIQLALKDKSLSITEWESVLQEALHAIRSLLYTTTNATPHERMFGHPRRSSNGYSTPTWLLKPRTVLLRRFNRQSKFEPLVEEVTLLNGNNDYALIRYPDGRESTVSTSHLAPRGEDNPTANDGPAPLPSESTADHEISNEGSPCNSGQYPCNS